MCARCEELEAEVAYLKSELGLVHDEAVTGVLRSQFKLTPQSAPLLEVLYRAKGRVIDKYRLHEMPGASGEDVNIIGVHVCRIRHALGREAVKTVWGTGFAIGPRGAQVIEEAEMLAAAQIARAA